MSVVLFDLDGTLVDTAHDLSLALNMQLARHGKLPLKYDDIWPVASHGSRGLLALGFGITPQDESFEAMRVEYLDLYESVFTNNPILLPEIAELLDALDARGIQWGIVTNKPRRFSVDLTKAVSMGNTSLHERSACLLCGDDAAHPKPAPDTLLMACKAVNAAPDECIYVGDAERDVQAAKAAGMHTVVALFGYIAETDKPAEWGADVLIQSPLALLNYLS
ncbi:MAG: phosphoglycolate phosphatase [Betaproteobacteria bacterium HGW-Betaproteobacteria-20]|nr:MAG: phosphoglycolate phosphatase [Betaproteobacteria bacterium HGW-Betaproteobacteria-20]